MRALLRVAALLLALTAWPTGGVLRALRRQWNLPSRQEHLTEDDQTPDLKELPVRRLALATAPLALIAFQTPALAQTAAPTPGATSTPCPSNPSCDLPGGGRPTQTPHQDERCPDPLVTFPGGGITSGQEARIGIGFDTPQRSATYTVSLNRESPAPFAVVRSEQTTATGTVFTVRLGESHHFTAVMRRNGAECVFGGGSVRFTVPVRAAVSLAARRNAPRDYTFSGRVLPGYGSVSLYRVESSGRRVLTSRADVVDGLYRIDRRFLGSGRFGFVVVADPGSTGRHVGGESAVRPTVVH